MLIIKNKQLALWSCALIKNEFKSCRYYVVFVF